MFGFRVLPQAKTTTLSKRFYPEQDIQSTIKISGGLQGLFEIIEIDTPYCSS